MLKTPSAAGTWTSCTIYRDTIQERNDYASSVKKSCNFIIALKSDRLTLRTYKVSLLFQDQTAPNMQSSLGSTVYDVVGDMIM